MRVGSAHEASGAHEDVRRWVTPDDGGDDIRRKIIASAIQASSTVSIEVTSALWYVQRTSNGEGDDVRRLREPNHRYQRPPPDRAHRITCRADRTGTGDRDRQ